MADKSFDLLKDIAEIVRDDTEHHVNVRVEPLGVTVYLDYDPELAYEGNCIIPIHYTTVEEFAYIPDDEYRDMYCPGDFGIDVNEIRIIEKIMTYLEEHKDYINEICQAYDIGVRFHMLAKESVDKAAKEIEESISKSFSE